MSKKRTSNNKNNNCSLSAQRFVDQLLEEGTKISCDDSNKNFDVKDLPPFYDEDLFKRGQQFFYKHISALFACKLLGLLAILSIPSILKLLMFTKMSGDTISAYKRYMATIFHMMVWYDEDFKPGSKLWKSIRTVRNLHNSASKSGCKAGLNRISQKDMALTQFGFMGFAITRREIIGIHHASEEEFRAFIHVWRVVGYLMGIEDRFNVCKESVEETKEICEMLIGQVFRPLIEKKDENFLKMCKHLVDGLWVFDMLILYETTICGLHSIVQDDYEVIRASYIEINFFKKQLYYFGVWLLEMLKFDTVRVVLNFIRVFELKMMKFLPVMAFYMYGAQNAIVDIKV